MGNSTAKKTNPAQAVLASWNRLKDRPGGRWLFNKMLGRMIPYTGSIGAQVEELVPGRARVVLKDRKAVRNHLRSIHAVALANLGELATGLATTTCFTSGTRGILTGIGVEYHKKARGLLVAECSFEAPAKLDGPTPMDVQTHIKDGAGDVVATVTATWLFEEME